MDPEQLKCVLGILFDDQQSKFLSDPINEFGISEIKTVSDRETSARPNESERKNNKEPKPQIPDDEPLDFEELGIIEVDDEEWNEYDDLGKVPVLKGKMKNISPQLHQDRSSAPQKIDSQRAWSGKRRNQQHSNNFLNP